MLHAAKVFGRLSCVSVVVAIALLAWVSPAQARVKKIVVDKKVSPAFDGASFGAAGQYETLAGRAFGAGFLRAADVADDEVAVAGQVPDGRIDLG